MTHTTITADTPEPERVGVYLAYAPGARMELFHTEKEWLYTDDSGIRAIKWKKLRKLLTARHYTLEDLTSHDERVTADAQHLTQGTDMTTTLGIDEAMVRFSDAEPSRQAAKRVMNMRSTHRAMVLKAFRYAQTSGIGPITGEQLVDIVRYRFHCPASPQSIRSRKKELAEDELIEYVDRKGIMRESHAMASRWQITVEGIIELSKIERKAAR